MRKYIVMFVSVLALALGVAVLPPAGHTQAQAALMSPDYLVNSKYSDGMILASPHFWGGSPKTRKYIPIGKRSGFRPTRSLYNPSNNCKILIAPISNHIVHFEFRGRGWKNLVSIDFATGKWEAELWCK